MRAKSMPPIALRILYAVPWNADMAVWRAHLRTHLLQVGFRLGKLARTRAR